MRFLSLAFILTFLALLPAKAAEKLQWGAVTASGDLMQGGLVRGVAPAGYQLRLNDIDLPLGENGEFVFGFHRDHAATTNLAITDAAGATVLHRLSIAPRDYQIQRIDGLPPKKVTPPESVLTRIKDGRAKVGKARATSADTPWYATDFIWPAKGPLSGVYGSQRILNGEPRWPHYGIDIAVPTGTPVLAPAGGKVMLAERDMYFEGGLIILDHGHNLNSALMHLSRLDVKVGDIVKQGDVIGAVGATGRATGPHLDWRMNWRDQRVDVQLLVPPQE